MINKFNYIETEDSIRGFFDKYRAFSNFDTTPFTMYVNGCLINFKSGEHAYHYFKTFNGSWQDKILSASSPSEAKKYGRACPMRSDWENVKVEIMEQILFNKFIQNDQLMRLLISTGDKYLEEANNWGDTYWGVCNGIGQNNLGYALMRVRSCIKRYISIHHERY